MRTQIVVSSLLALTQAFYIPGFSYKSYRDGDTIPLLINKVYSDYSELQYAFAELPFTCPPTGRVRAGHITSGTSISLNLGEVLRGDRIVISDYELVMGVDTEARYLCSQTVDLEGIRQAKELIRDGFVAEWIVDNLPGATSFQTVDKSRKYYAAGFKIGDETRVAPGGPAEYLLNNHVTLVIRYRRAPGKDGNKGKKVIVGFEVFPRSITADARNESGLPEHIEGDHEPLVLAPQANGTNATNTESGSTTLTIPYTYSVYWREDEGLEWQDRWDMYLAAQDGNESVHWLAIINSLAICGLLTFITSVMLTRTIRNDIKGQKGTTLADLPKANTKTSSPKREKGNLLGPLADLDTDDDDSDDGTEDIIGWKLLHGDVFRAPPYGGVFAPLIGSGMQLLYMAFGLLILSTLGVLNPSFRGGYVSVGVGLFVFAGIFSGYFSARMYKTAGGRSWQKNVIITAALVPGLLFATIFILNLFVWIQASSTALPFGTLIALVLLWLFVQLPLVYAGSWFGFERMGAYVHPIKANAIPRQMPDRRWYKSVQSCLLAGLLPFMVILLELMLVVQSLWVDKTTYYYAFGFTGVVSAVLAITVIEVTILSTYVLLCSENYHWWWHSFAVGGSSSLWVYAYLVYCYFTKLHITGFVSSILFFAYGLLATCLYALLTAEAIDVNDLNAFRDWIKDTTMKHPQRRTECQQMWLWIVEMQGLKNVTNVCHVVDEAIGRIQYWEQNTYSTHNLRQDPDHHAWFFFTYNNAIMEVMPGTPGLGKSCLICTEDFNAHHNRPNKNPCGHFQCSNCSDQPLEHDATKFTCPFCRACLVCGRNACTDHIVAEQDHESANIVPLPEVLSIPHFMCELGCAAKDCKPTGRLFGLSPKRYWLLREETRATRCAMGGTIERSEVLGRLGRMDGEEAQGLERLQEVILTQLHEMGQKVKADHMRDLEREHFMET
ncbi:hypothetical protein E8E13_008632 [Curvularia kusanoi]|uniref:Transmembrane 9 superfamily member n=1 Tax=Curvularia kusanoi TaxID=90978 RepID=A0A9P4W8M0_CURKU|nr:hypothetical protein E8E13_008632 [Curvularia kusanoi]